MVATTLRKTEVTAPVFPAAEVKHRLRRELEKIAENGSVLRPDWEPLLDSKRVVGTVLAVEGLFPFKVPPDKVVRKGGYNTVDDAIDDMCKRIEGIWDKNNKPRVRR